MQDIYYPSKDGKNTVHACLWLPQGKAKAVVQLIHGMCEYAERYAPFAQFLNEHGYIVCADDHLGHGKTAKTEEDLGYFNDQRDYNIVVEDIHELKLTVQKQTGELPWLVLGHSMGSFFCRKYISVYGNEFAGAVIMGTGFKSSITLNTALSAVKASARSHGWRYRSNTIKKLAFGSYNKKFRPARTGNDWLSKNPQNVDAYEKDPLCGFDFTNNGYFILFSIIKQACSKPVINAVPKNLPVYFVAGALDPVGDYGKGVIRAVNKFHKAGVKNVSLTLYEDSRHEILNDDCKQQVQNDLLAFFEGILNGEADDAAKTDNGRAN